MTVTKRKQKPRDTGGPDLVPSTSTSLESGMKASCDSCSADITHSVHVRCAEPINPSSDRLVCNDFDLCVPCFLQGKQIGPHKSHHAYRIISSHAFPIFHPDWGADEELLLIEGAQMYGLGNWSDIAEHVGGRTKDECMNHYFETFIWSQDYPLPTVQENLDDDQEAFQKRKKIRLEEVQARPVPLPPPKPMASAPTCHEIGGFMPARLEFETEYENEAETLIKDLEFGKVYAFGGAEQPASLEEVLKLEKEKNGEVVEEPGKKKTKDDDEGEKKEEDEEEGGEEEGGEEEKEKTPPPPPMGQAPGDELQEDLELKLTLLDMFNERYDKRVAAKELIADRGLIGYKQIVVNERKRNKEERDLILRTKPFARIQTALDHESFVDGLLHELALRKRISELQEYRRMGVTSIADGERYEHAKAQRSSRSGFRDPLTSHSRHRTGAGGHFHSPGMLQQPIIFKPVSSGAPSKPPTSTPAALTLASANSLHLLTVLEQQLCSTLRILPKPYLFLKETLLREWTRRAGKLTVIQARDFIVRKPEMNDGIDVEMNGPNGEEEWGEKVERVWEFIFDTVLKGKPPGMQNGAAESDGMKSVLRPTQGSYKAVMNGNGGVNGATPKIEEVDEEMRVVVET